MCSYYISIDFKIHLILTISTSFYHLIHIVIPTIRATHDYKETRKSPRRLLPSGTCNLIISTLLSNLFKMCQENRPLVTHHPDSHHREDRTPHRCTRYPHTSRRCTHPDNYHRCTHRSHHSSLHRPIRHHSNRNRCICPA